MACTTFSIHRLDLAVVLNSQLFEWSILRDFAHVQAMIPAHLESVFLVHCIEFLGMYRKFGQTSFIDAKM